MFLSYSIKYPFILRLVDRRLDKLSILSFTKPVLSRVWLVIEVAKMAIVFQRHFRPFGLVISVFRDNKHLAAQLLFAYELIVILHAHVLADKVSLLTAGEGVYQDDFVF